MSLGRMLPLLFLALAFSARAEDAITLDDGRVLRGQIISEDANNVMLQQADGEASVVARSRIAKMEKKAGAPDAGKNAAIPQVPVMIDRAQAEIKPEPAKVLDAEAIRAGFAELKDLGAPELAKRKAALEKAKNRKQEYMPLMLAMLHPKQKLSDEYMRIGVLRAFWALAPLPDDAAKTLAYSAVFDPYPEARREACRTIRYLLEDRAVRDLVTWAVSEDSSLKRSAIIALHEIDDNRIYAALIRTVPTPTVTGNFGDPQGLTDPKYVLPTGPGGLRLPIFLPTQSVAGTATDIGSPVTELLKLLANKDLGNLPYAWINWYREKTGEISGGEDRSASHEKRSMRDRMGAPPSEP